MALTTSLDTPETTEIFRLIGERVGSADVQSRITTLLSDIATVDLVVDTNNSLLTNGTYGLSALKTLIDGYTGTISDLGSGATLAANLSDIYADTSNLDTNIGTPSDLGSGATISANISDVHSRIGAPVGANISADIAALKSVADNINNSTRVNASVPTLVEIPESGTEYYRITHNIFDSAGLPIDSNADKVYFRVVDAAGVAKTGIYFSDNAGTAITAATGGLGPHSNFDGWYLMNTAPVGRATAFLGIASTATQEGLTVEFGHIDATSTTTAIVVSRSTNAVNYLQAQGQAGVTSDAVWDEAAGDHVSAGSTGKYLTDVYTATVTTIPGLIGTPADLGTGTTISANLSDIKTLLSEVDVNLDAYVGTLTDLGSGATIAANLSDISTAIATLDSVLDGYVGTVSNFGSGATLAANLSDINTSISSHNSALSGYVGTLTDLGSGATIGANFSDISTALGVVDGYHDVPTADSAANAQMRDVIGNKTDTSAGDSVVAKLVKVQETLDAEQNAGTLFRATSLTNSVVNGTPVTITLSTAQGFDCINARISRIKITNNGTCTDYTVRIFEDSGKTKELWSAQDDAGDNIDLMMSALDFTNQNATPDKNMYIEITNNTVSDTSNFDVEIRGSKFGDLLA